MIRVVIVDDQALIRTGFEMILNVEADIEVVATCNDGIQAVEAVRRWRPDVVLMDIRMPKLDGIAATREIMADNEAAGSGPRVLILTTFDLDEYVFEALQAGATGFLLKDTRPETLVEGLRIVADGEALLSPTITKRLIEQFVKQPSPTAPDAAVFNEITDREHDVLLCIARGLSNAEISQALIVSEATVKTHVSRVLAKLGVRDRVQAIVLAYEHGLVTPGAASS